MGQSIKAIFRATLSKWFISLVLVSPLFSMFPVPANAGILSFLTDWISNNSVKNASQQNSYIEKNSQNIPLLQNVVTYDLEGSKGGGDISFVGNEALLSENGPSGTLADIDDSVNTGQISRYMVRKGDTLSGIAQMFGVSVNTIVWANDVNSKTLKEGKVLIILPVSGTIHTVVKGDTLKTIAKKYKADSNEIMQFNDLNEETVLSIGNQIIIPDGEGSIKVSGTTVAVKNPLKGGSGGPEYAGYYIRPVIGGAKSQKLHGYNGIDIAINVGSPILASASGQVIVSRSSGWNGGYGKYIVISHYNGTQTVYGHLSETFISDGDTVVQGQVIGMTGNTGNSTGPHIHFEIRGAKNPF
ncbi:MAG: peptidoglycan DD-metalloendopeptidase family protein [bacterium]